MKQGTLLSVNNRSNCGANTITNPPVKTGLIPLIMMKRITLLSLLMMFFITGAFAQVPNAPVTKAGKVVVTASLPASVAVNVTVDNLVHVSGMGLTLLFNPAIMNYSSVSNMHVSLPGLSVQETFPGSGVLKMAWIAATPSNNIASLPNGTVLFTLNFANYNGGTSMLTWDNDPTGDSEYSGPFGQNPDLNGIGDYPDSPTIDFYKDGYVTNIATTLSSSVTVCNNPNYGEISITATGGSGNFIYKINDGTPVTQTTGTFTNLSSGTYVVSVIDAAFPGVELILDPALTLVVPTVNGYLYNPRLSAYYCTIGDAVTAAISGDVIQFVYPNTYTGFSYNDPNKALSFVDMTNGHVTFVGASPAFTLNSGNISFTGVSFITATNDPTILINGGKLTLRSCTITEAAGFTQAGVYIAAGELDAGITGDPGLNVFAVNGTGMNIVNAGTTQASALCNFYGDVTLFYVSSRISGDVVFDPWSNATLTNCGYSQIGAPVTYAGKVFAPAGTVTVPITVENFNNIDAISLALQFNAANLTFTGITYINPALTLTPALPNVVGNTLFIAWNADPSLTSGVTIAGPGQQLLFNLQFTTTTGTYPLVWNNTPTILCEYQNALIQGPYIDEPTINYYKDGFISDLNATVTASTNVICKGANDGTITVAATGGSTNYTFKVNAGTPITQPTGLFTGLAPGVYTISVIDATYPWVEYVLPGTVTIAEPATPLAGAGFESIRVRCKGESNGQATMNAAGGWGGIQYSINGINYQVNNYFDALPVGVYTLYARDAGGCVITDIVNITEPIVALTASGIESKVVTCKGGNDGQATLTGYDGWGGYLYSKDNLNYFLTPTLTGFTAGNYTLYVKDDGGCTIPVAVTITEPVDPLAVTATMTKVVSCKDGNDGEITAYPFGGWGTYTFSLNNVNYQTSPLFTGLTAGTYTVYVKDLHGCVVSTSPVVVTEPALLTGVISGDNTVCYGQSSLVTINFAGGNPPYTVVYKTTTGSNQTISGINASSYSFTQPYTATTTWNLVSLTDAKSCVGVVSGSATITVNPLPVVTLSYNTTQVTGSTYTYCWDDVVTVELASVVAGTGPFNITGTLGSVPFSVFGVSVGDNLVSTSLAAGSHNFVITSIEDANGCLGAPLSVYNATVVVNEEPIISFGFNGQEAAGPNFQKEYCYNEPVHVTLFAEYFGTAPYSVTYELNGVTSTVTMLSAGSTLFGPLTLAPNIYNIVVTDITDANGCSAGAAFLALCTAEITINEEPMISFGFNGVEAGHNATFEYCYNVPVGVTLFNYYGGTAPYSVTYEVNGVTNTVTNLYQGGVIAASQIYLPGTYNIVVTDITDAKGCKASAAFLAVAKATITINPEPAIGFSFNGNLAGTGSVFEYCFDEPVMATLSHIWSGTAPFAITWTVDDGNGPVTSSLSGLGLNSPLFGSIQAPGSYLIQVTSIVDAKGCSPSNYAPYTATVVIHPEPAVGFTFKSLAGTGSSFAYCYDENVEVTLTDIWSGTAPFNISWTVSDGFGPVTSMTYTGAGLGTTLFNNIFAPGNYTVQITSIVDAEGCSPASYAPYVAYVTVHPEPMVTIPANVNACHGASTVNLPYTAALNGPDQYLIDFDNVANAAGFADVTITGLPASPMIAPSSATAAPGVYNAILYVKNSTTGCVSQAIPFTVTVPNPFTITPNPTHVTCNGANDGQAAVNVTGSWGGYTYLWNDPAAQTTNPAVNLYAGIYSVVVTDAEGCTATAAVTITEPDVLAAIIAKTDITCHGLTNGKIDVTNPTGGYGTYEYRLNNGTWQTSGAFTGLAAGTYVVEIRDAAHTSCTVILGSLTIVEPAPNVVSGVFNYHNFANTPLNNVTVKLEQSSVAIYTTATGANGAYSFPNVCPGTYEVVASTLKSTLGSVNSTDAVQANIWGISPATIQKVVFVAGDVNDDDLVNAGDAGDILDHFLSGGTLPFFRGPWAFWKANETIATNPFVDGTYPTITVVSSSLVQNFYGLATGDFNRSFTPGTAKSGSSVTVTNHNALQTNGSAEILVPVTVGQDMDVTAISLVLNYPADKVEVLGVALGSDLQVPVRFEAGNGVLRIAHVSLMPLMLNQNDALLTLRLKPLSGLVPGESVTFVLAADPLNELAGADYQGMVSALLNISVIEGVVSVPELPFAAQIAMSNHPNPFAGTTTFAYTLPVDGKVTLAIYDMTGRLVRTLIQETQSAGSHAVVLDQELETGVYMANLMLTTGDGTISRTIRIMSRK